MSCTNPTNPRDWNSSKKDLVKKTQEEFELELELEKLSEQYHPKGELFVNNILHTGGITLLRIVNTLTNPIRYITTRITEYAKNYTQCD